MRVTSYLKCILLSLLVLILLSSFVAAPPGFPGGPGGPGEQEGPPDCITCSNDGECYLPSDDTSSVDCTISSSQTIVLLQGTSSTLSTWAFNSITFEGGGTTLSFLNEGAPSANNGVAATGHGSSNGAGASSSGSSSYTSGGEGGDGCFRDATWLACTPENLYGGAGGGGGAGGTMFRRGGYGGAGGDDVHDEFSPGSITYAGGGGANVALEAKSLIYSESSSSGIISVSGSNGETGNRGGGNTTACDCAAGSSGGGGGGGAGRLTLNVGLIDGKFTFKANGGNGGNGGPGSNGKDTCNGAPGGAGGSGAHGEIFVTTNEIKVEPTYQMSDSSYVASAGNYYNDGLCEGTPFEGGGDANNENGEATVKFGEADCEDGLDDDYDGYTDLADADCFNTVVHGWINHNDEPLYPWSTTYDNDGPVKYLVPPGTHTGDLTYFPAWNPFAVDGSDGVCGNDAGPTGCFNRPNAACSNYGNYNVQENCVPENLPGCTYVPPQCSGPSDVSCSKFTVASATSASAACEAFAPASCVGSFTQEFIPCSEGESCEQTSTNTASCDGVYDCSSLLSPEELSVCDTEGDCTLADPDCTGTLDCSSRTTVGDCPVGPACQWQGGSDLGYVGQTYDEEGESSESRYFCNQDFQGQSSERENGFNIWLPGEGESLLWKWWDARQLGIPFKSHWLPLNNDHVEFISNGAEWYYCNATDEYANSLNSNNAYAIAEAGSFEPANNDGSFFCSNRLSSLAALFEDNGDCELIDFVDGEGNSLSSFGPFYDNETINSLSESDEFVCAAYNGIPSYTYNSQAEFSTQCFENCYVPETTEGIGGETISYFLDDLLISNPGCYDAIYEELCITGAGGSWSFCQEGGFLDSSGSSLYEKDECGLDLSGCLQEAQPNYADNCGDITLTPENDGTFTDFTAFPCEKDNYCLLGEHILSGDLGDPTIGSCCLLEDSAIPGDTDSICGENPDPMTGPFCASLGGDFLSDPGQYRCDPSADLIIGEFCCLGSWVPDFEALAVNDLVQPEAFICYEHAGDARIAECCTDYTTCNAQEDGSLFEGRNTNDLGFYGKGGVIHTLLNYDSYSGSPSKPRDFIKVSEFTPSNKEVTEPFNTKVFIISNQLNISTFDYLEFDVAFNLANLSKNTNVSLKFKDDNHNVEVCELGYLYDYLVNGYEEMRWHRAILPVKEMCDNKPLENIVSINFEYDNYAKIAFDNFFLSENPENGFNNTPNYYCTGNYGSWINNLDGPSDGHFLTEYPDAISIYDVSLSDTATSVGSGKYWYACEAQASFDWTGRACCGDDTKEAFGDGTSNEAEYFADIRAGCFHGNPILNDHTVGQIMNDPEYNDILFYEGNFTACVLDRHDKTVAYTPDNVIVGDALVANTVEPYTVKGTHICLENGLWMKTRDFPTSRLIASTLYGFTLDDTSLPFIQAPYELICESFENVVPYEKSSYESENTLLEIAGGSSFFENGFIKDFCTLTYEDDGNIRTVVGFSFNNSEGTSVHDVLNLLGDHLEASNYLLGLESNFAESCDGVFPNEDFYNLCYSGNADDIGLSYNPSFNIIIVAQGITDTAVDVEGFFKMGTFSETLLHLWKNFIGLFSGWFAKDASLQHSDLGEPVFTDESRMAFLTEDVSLIVSNKAAQFDRLFMASYGDKEILGLIETPRSGTNKEKYIVVQYRNFANISPIVENYLGTGLINNWSYGYTYGLGDTQVVSLGENSAEKLRGRNFEDVVKGFEPEFNWRRMTAYLRVNASTPFTAQYNSIPGNCNIELGEECDSCSSGPDIYKFGASTCARWYNNVDYDLGILTCTNNIVDHSTCAISTGI